MTKPLKCAWNMKTSCDGTVAITNIFSNQLTIPICEKHVREHNVVMNLNEEGADIDYITSINNSERERTVVDNKMNYEMIKAIYTKIFKYKVRPIELNILSIDNITTSIKEYLKKPNEKVD